MTIDEVISDLQYSTVETAPQIIEWLKELKGYRDAKTGYSPIGLPCKVDDTVWYIDDSFNEPIECIIEYIEICKDYTEFFMTPKDYPANISFKLDDLGKTWFLSREGALQEGYRFKIPDGVLKSLED